MRDAPLAACQRGLEAVGFEPHPVLVRVARAKMDYGQASRAVGAIERVLLEGLPRQPVDSLTPDAARFLQSLFPTGHLAALLGARDALRAEFGESDLAFLVLSRVVDRCSHSQTDGIYKAPTSRKRAEDPTTAVHKVLAMLAEDLRGGIPPGRRPSGIIHEQSSADMSVLPDASVDVIVTSPPYLNNFDYAEMTRMLLYFWGIAGSWRKSRRKCAPS